MHPFVRLTTVSNGAPLGSDLRHVYVHTANKALMLFSRANKIHKLTWSLPFSLCRRFLSLKDLSNRMNSIVELVYRVECPTLAARFQPTNKNYAQWLYAIVAPKQIRSALMRLLLYPTSSSSYLCVIILFLFFVSFLFFFFFFSSTFSFFFLFIY